MKYTSKQLKEMSLSQLRKIAESKAIEYYKSSRCLISFGNRTPEQAAAMLANSASKSSLVKDILSIQKRMA